MDGFRYNPIEQNESAREANKRLHLLVHHILCMHLVHSTQMSTEFNLGGKQISTFTPFGIQVVVVIYAVV